jgi:hypothetical protein
LVFVLFAAYATRVGAIPGLLSFLAVVTLLMERNHEVLTRFPNQKPRLPTPSFGLPIQAPPLLGVKEEHAYEPPQQGDHNEEKYEQVEDIHDHREDLPVPPQGSQATSFYTEKGL